jgi:hypothetical protein
MVMTVRGHKSAFRAVRLAASLFAAGLAMCVSVAPSSAEGFFESLFGGLRRVFQVPARHFDDPFSSFARAVGPPLERAIEADRGPTKAFCVRTCDGHYFPVRAHPGFTVAQACHAFCPASETRIYSGSNIDYAQASDGSRYAALANAYAYRKHLVAGCTCNGSTPFGLAHIDAKSDPTLRPGDVVVTQNGLMAFNGNRNTDAPFTPVESYARFSKSYRDKLSALKVAPVYPSASQNAALTPAASAQADERHSAQLVR